MNKQSSTSSQLTTLLSTDNLFPNLVAATLLAVVKLTSAISLGALVFSGALAPYLPTGIGLFLVGFAIGGLLIAGGSGFKAIVAGPRGGQAPILASMAAAIVLSMSGQAEESIVATVVAAILVSTVVIGVMLFLVGWARLGVLVRYIPYPVMGGFFAGLGYLLLEGGIVVTLGSVADTQDIRSFLTVNSVSHLAPALLFAVALYVLKQRRNHWLLMPGFLLGGLILFYLVLALTGTSVESATREHWLLSIDTEAKFFPVIHPGQFDLINWSAVVGQTGTILVMALMSMIVLLLDTSGTEIILNRDLDPNHELRTAGWANVINGLCSGSLAIQSASDTAFTYQVGGNRFSMVAAFTILMLATLLIGPGPIAFMPKAILGGLLIYLGIDFLMDWAWYSRSKLPATDYGVILAILLVVALYGILEGVAVGILLAMFLFVHSYSQLSVIKSSMSGLEFVSNIDRDQKKRAYLDDHGEAIHIFVLQGFLFFGTASRLLEDIRTLLDDSERSPVRYLVLDFHRVDALDTSATRSFAKLLQICIRDDIALVLTGCSVKVADQLRSLTHSEESQGSRLRIFGELDEGVGWCEDDILEAFAHDSEDEDWLQLLTQLMGDHQIAEVISPSFEKIAIKAGESLFRQGEAGDALYIVLHGSVSIVLELPGDKTLHLRTMRSGAIVGEMSLYTDAPRSATGLVNDDSVFYRLERRAFEQMNTEQSREAVSFHSFIVRLMSERLARANREIMALSR